MRILWIEDGGAKLPQRAVAIELFKHIIPNGALDREYNIDEEIWTELPRVFREFSRNRIFVCRSYLEWKETYDSEGGDFDLILIDINLEKFQTPKSERPFPHKDFDKKAGLVIYNQLLKDGFPEDHIAFFTGETVTIKQFSDQLQSALITPPTHAFEKKPEGYRAAAAWIKERVSRPYNLLRRGIIEGCHFVSAELNAIPDEDLEQQLLFYKTTYENVDSEPEHYKDEVQNCLNRLRDFFPLQEPQDKAHRFYQFVAELAREWSQSTGSFVGDIPEPSSYLEEYFLIFSQRYMHLIHEWMSGQKFCRTLTEREIALYFMIAMRACFHLDFDHVQDHEAYFQPLFDSVSPETLENHIQSNLDRKLTHSLRSFAKEVEVTPNTVTAPVYLDFLGVYGTIPDMVKGRLRIVHKKEIRKRSSNLLYQAFWHGVCPGWLEGKRTNIDIAELQKSNKSNLVRYLAALTYKDAFSSPDRC